MDSLKSALAKPACAALLGKSWCKNYDYLLKRLSVQIVTPDFQPSPDQMAAWWALSQKGSPYLAVTELYGPGWVLAKPKFGNLTVSQQTTVLIHELRHQAEGALGEPSPTDPGAKAWYQNEINSITAACGTESPYKPRAKRRK